MHERISSARRAASVSAPDAAARPHEAVTARRTFLAVPLVDDRAVGLRRPADGFGDRRLAPGRKPVTGVPAVLRRSFTALRRSAGGPDPLGGQEAPPEVKEVLRRRSGGGQPLPESLGGRLGHQMGHDFSSVRVHADAESDTVARSVQAVAFTHGRDVYFSSGSYAPGSASGQRLLAHELAHVSAGETGRATGSTTTIGRADDPAEAAADRVADQAMAGLTRGGPVAPTSAPADPTMSAAPAPTRPGEPLARTIRREILDDLDAPVKKRTRRKKKRSRKHGATPAAAPAAVAPLATAPRVRAGGHRNAPLPVAPQVIPAVQALPPAPASVPAQPKPSVAAQPKHRSRPLPAGPRRPRLPVWDAEPAAESDLPLETEPEPAPAPAPGGLNMYATTVNLAEEEPLESEPEPAPAPGGLNMYATSVNIQESGEDEPATPESDDLLVPDAATPATPSKPAKGHKHRAFMDREIDKKYSHETSVMAHDLDPVIRSQWKNMPALKACLAALQGGTSPLKAATHLTDLPGAFRGQVAATPAELASEAVAIVQSEIDRLTELARLQEVPLDDTGLVGDVKGRKVHYDSQEEQKKSSISLKGGLLYRSTGELVDTAESSTFHSGKGSEIFVVSNNGDIHMASHKVGKYHHSSLLAASNVACGGEMIVTAGKITSISNKSGHYMPTQDHLVQFLHWLEKDGISLDFPVAQGWGIAGGKTAAQLVAGKGGEKGQSAKNNFFAVKLRAVLRSYLNTVGKKLLQEFAEQHELKFDAEWEPIGFLKPEVAKSFIAALKAKFGPPDAVQDLK